VLGASVMVMLKVSSPGWPATCPVSVTVTVENSQPYRVRAGSLSANCADVLPQVLLRAQSGTQVFQVSRPWPYAPCGPHRAQIMPTATILPSPQARINLGGLVCGGPMKQSSTAGAGRPGGLLASTRKPHPRPAVASRAQTSPIRCHKRTLVKLRLGMFGSKIAGPVRDQQSSAPWHAAGAGMPAAPGRLH